MIHVICQWLLVGELVGSLLLIIYRDINGMPAQEPSGFAGVVMSLIFTGLIALVFWGAGAFSLLPWSPP